MRLAELIGRYSGEEPIRLELVNGETRVIGQKLILEDEEEPGQDDGT